MNTAAFLNQIPVGEKFFCKEGLNGPRKFRVTKEKDGNIFVFSPGRSRYGRRMTEEDFLKRYTILPWKAKDENAAWHKRIDRAMKAIKTSGLWPEKVKYLENLKKLSWEDKKAMEKLYWASWASRWWDHIEVAREMLKPYAEKYPFIWYITEDGDIQIDTSYLYELSDVKLKSMYFGKWQNKEIKEKIKMAIGKKEAIKERARTSYDVSFSYDPKCSKAWYSEEYKDCWNGHYYIALDENLAWFCEND